MIFLILSSVLPSGSLINMCMGVFCCLALLFSLVVCMAFLTVFVHSASFINVYMGVLCCFDLLFV